MALNAHGAGSVWPLIALASQLKIVIVHKVYFLCATHRLALQAKNQVSLPSCFTSDKVIPTLTKYRIAVTSKGDVSTVMVQGADGIPETSANADKIIKLLADEIK
jgi:hypothetical protein